MSNMENLTLALGSIENTVYPTHPNFPDERVRVGVVMQSKSWILMAPPDARSNEYRHLRGCSDAHRVDLELLDSMGLIERDCDGPPGSYVVKISSKEKTLD